MIRAANAVKQSQADGNALPVKTRRVIRTNPTATTKNSPRDRADQGEKGKEQPKDSKMKAFVRHNS